MLEFNELTPALMDRFIAEGQLPNFARMRDAAVDCLTDAQEAAPYLEPWIQWVTVHTGLSYAEHKCFNLNDGGSLNAKRIWDLVGEAGGTSWICGSINSAFDGSIFKGHFLPDPWSVAAADHPAGYFKAYSDVVRPFVQEHSGRPDVSTIDMARFARFMIRNGLNIETVTATIRQLAGERAASTKWRRALILDRLQWDLFRHIYRRSRPDFATFFLNSTAHFQHFHWREMEPETFAIRPTEHDRETYADAILAGYRNMDRIVGDAMRLAGEDSAVVMCTALSQQPMLTFESTGGKQIFRHRDVGQLLKFAGVNEPCTYAPVMSQEFLLHCDSERDAHTIADKLRGLVLEDGRQIMWATPTGTKVDAGCNVYSDPGPALVRSPMSNDAVRFVDLFYPLESLRSGMHSPEGLFWVKAPGLAARKVDRPVPLTDIFPTLLDLLGIGSPAARRLDAAT
jgi:hypothetical protein